MALNFKTRVDWVDIDAYRAGKIKIGCKDQKANTEESVEGTETNRNADLITDY